LLKSIKHIVFIIVNSLPFLSLSTQCSKQHGQDKILEQTEMLSRFAKCFIFNKDL